MKGKILYSLVIIVTLSCASTLHAQPSTDSACTTAISQIINRTYPNETALVLNSGRGTSKPSILRLADSIFAAELTYCRFAHVGPRDLGNYDECQATQGAHYCLLSVRNHDVVLLLTGLCAPSVCSGPELTTSAFALLAALNISIPADDIAAIRCVTKSDVQPVTTGGTVVLSFIGFLVLLAIIGTTIEYVRMRLVSSANSDCSELNETNDFAEPGAWGNASKTFRNVFLMSFFAIFSRFCAGLAASEKESLDENDPASINSAAPTPESESLLHHRRIPPPTTSWSSKIVAKLTEFLLAFSVISNATRLFAASPEKNLSSLNGIRVLSMLWIIVGHTVLFSSSLVLNIQYVMEHVIGSWLFMLIPGAEYSVDTFFYMSGFLVSYLTLKTLETKQRLNWALFYFHRVWRIIPPLAMMMLVYWKVAPLFGNGPFWVAFSASQQQCDSYWWATLLRTCPKSVLAHSKQIETNIFMRKCGIDIQNFYPDFESTCVGWTWYLANDMQFYIITPAILILYWKRPKLGLGLIGIMLIASFIASGVINVQEGYYARASGPGHAWTDKIYNKPYIRIPAYLGTCLRTFLNSEKTLTKARDSL